MENLTIFSIQGTIIIGDFEYERNRLLKPRRVMFQQVNKNQVTVLMQGFPGDPAFIVVKDYGFYYPVKDKALSDVYAQATSGIVIPEKKIHLAN